ncbi:MULTISPECIES: endonuclease/exonuclease/phosphatase family protein [Streptomyces]|uniref:Endonuclease/exonuclease/phosphatase family protein n=1 Tax=Streptomyces solicathayae TaxID=3081768 RepID=A0ABZ0LUH5_9ACTN|nr:endonuclease/exonuclease/phosphatase family protein [Streptomyces sp. HUAS YS2]WOX23154.1 endonuclease/exonuclease/phosphatase family protein [Streptomyces sp. HUAS YS2]
MHPDPGSRPGPDPGAAPPAPPGPRPRRGVRAVAAWAAALLVAVPVVVTACRLIGTDAFTPVPQLLSALPWLTVPAAVALPLALAARSRTLVGITAAALAGTLWYLQGYGPGSTGADGPVVARLRVLASNVEFGVATGRLLAAARAERPQLMFVTECDPACVRTLADGLRDRLPYRVTVDGAGSTGSAILSAYPLTAEPPLPAAMGMPGAKARIGGRDVRLRLAHPLPPLPGQVDGWRAELGRVRSWAATAVPAGPVLLAGDFNASQDHAAFRDILDTGLHDAARLTGEARTPTWPREGAVPTYTQIDHVLAGRDFSARGTRFLDLAGTDHRAVLADLDLHADG